MTWKEIIEIVVSFFSGAAISAVVTLRYSKTTTHRENTVTQTSNKAGGSVVGGDYIQK